MAYIELDLTVDSTALADDASAWLETGLPGWQPAPGNLETLLIEAVARIASQLAVLAGRVPVEIFQYFGERVLKIPSLTATSATGTLTVTLTDTLGHTIPSGTQFAIGTVAFESTTDVIVNVGSSSASVPVLALTPGAAGSGLTGSADVLTALAFVGSAVVAGTTTGGSDGETDQEYVDRLSDELPTLSPKAILLADFEALARSDPTVERALAIDNFVPGVNEIQQLALTGATGGTFTLTYAGQTTAAIAYNATAATVQAALAALSNIGAGNVIVTGGPLSTAPVVVEFRGGLAASNLAQMTTTATGLTPGGATATVTTLRDGNATVALSGAEGAVSVAIHDSAGDPLSATVKSSVLASFGTDGRVLNLSATVIDPAYTTIDVAFTAHCYTGWDPATVQAQAIAALQSFLSPANWGQPALGQSRVWIDEPTVRRNDLIGVVYAVEGVRHVDTLTLAVGGGTQATTDVTMTGPASLPRPGAITGTVTT